MPQPHPPLSPYTRVSRFLVFVAAALIAGILVAGSSLDASAAQKCIKIGQKTICFDDGKGQKGGGQNGDAGQGGGGGDPGGAPNNGGGGDQGGAPDNGGGNPQPEPKPLDCAKAQCDAGEIKLDKPSRYGACCAPAEGLCPADRPVGTPPNCCAHGTVFREGGCYPETCGPGTVGTPPHCDRVCAPGKIKVDQSCYDPCPPGTLGTPPNCRCPSGQIWDKDANACKGCPSGMVGTPPNCQCPANTVLKDGTCQSCPGGMVVKGGQCQCPKGTAPNFSGVCQKCEGGRVPIDGKCQCPKGTMAWPGSADDCKKGTREVCTWRGTAPGCDGSCEAGEEYRGGAHSSNAWSGSGPVPGGFGSSCWSGSKHYCCRLQ